MNKFLEKLQIRLTQRFIGRIQRIENQININALTIQNELNRFEEIGNKLNELDNQIILNINEMQNHYDNIQNITNKINRLSVNNENYYFQDHYEYWKAKRIVAIVEHYGENFSKERKFHSWDAVMEISEKF